MIRVVNQRKKNLIFLILFVFLSTVHILHLLLFSDERGKGKQRMAAAFQYAIEYFLLLFRLKLSPIRNLNFGLYGITMQICRELLFEFSLFLLFFCNLHDLVQNILSVSKKLDSAWTESVFFKE